MQGNVAARLRVNSFRSLLSWSLLMSPLFLLDPCLFSSVWLLQKSITEAQFIKGCSKNPSIRKGMELVEGLM